MTIIYLLLLPLAAFPLVLTAWRMKSSAKIQKNGVLTTAVITHITTFRARPGANLDFLRLEYKDGATGKAYKGKATAAHLTYKVGDTMPLTYLPDKPSKYAIDTKKGYLGILIFCIILFLFSIFAAYKIDEMMRSGQY